MMIGIIATVTVIIDDSTHAFLPMKYEKSLPKEEASSAESTTSMNKNEKASNNVNLAASPRPTSQLADAAKWLMKDIAIRMIKNGDFLKLWKMPLLKIKDATMKMKA